jgi:hypothetical protein
MSALVLAHSLDALVLQHEGTQIVSDVRAEVDGARRGLAQGGRRAKVDGVAVSRRELQQELKSLRKELRKREDT